MGYNKSILEGHLTRDIEMKYTQAGAAIANTAIAVSRKFKTQAGEQKEEVLFLDVAFFGRTAEIANQFLRKGSHVLLDGRLKLDQWTAQDGTKRSKHSMTVEDLQMLGNKDEAQPGQPPSAPQGAYGTPAPQPTPGYGQPAATGQPAPQYAQPQPGAKTQPPQQAQPGTSTPPAAPAIVGYTPNGAPIYAQPETGAPVINVNEDQIPF